MLDYAFQCIPCIAVKLVLINHIENEILCKLNDFTIDIKNENSII